MRRAFTLIEVIIAVIIIAGSMIYILKLHGNSQREAHYIQRRALSAFEDSLFLTEATRTMRHDQSDAYSLHLRTHRFKRNATVKLLKSIERNITSEDVPFSSHEEAVSIPVHTIETFLSHRYKSTYYRLDIQGI